MKILPAIPGARPAMMLQGKGGIIFRYVDHTIVSGDEVIAVLSIHEACILGVLAKAKGRVVKWDRMGHELWLHDDDVSDPHNQIRQYISRIRKVLEPLGYKIENIYRHGYRLWPAIETDWSNPE